MSERADKLNALENDLRRVELISGKLMDISHCLFEAAKNSKGFRGGLYKIEAMFVQAIWLSYDAFASKYNNQYCRIIRESM